MALDEMPAHPRRRRDGALEVYAGIPRQVAEVRAPQRLGGDADFEVEGAELGDGETGAVNADAVA